MEERRRVAQPVVRIDDGGERLDQERPDDQTVRDPDRSAGPQTVGERADPQHEDGRGRDVQTGLREVAEGDARVLGRRTDPRGDADERAPADDETHAHPEPDDQPARAGDRPDEQVVQMARRFLVPDRCDLAGDRDRDQTGRDDEHEPQVRSRTGAAPTQACDHAVEAGRPSQGTPRRLRDQAEDQTDHCEHAHPGDDRGPREAERQAGLAAQEERSRPGRIATGERARAQIPSLRHLDRDDGQHRDHPHDGEERERLGTGERTELLDPAERARPSQPREAGDGVGHHPDQVRGREDARADQVGVVPGRGQLTHEQADRHEHRGRGDGRRREEQRRTGSDAHLRGTSPGDGKDRRGHPERDESDPEPDRALQRRASPGRAAREEQLPASGIFLPA